LRKESFHAGIKRELSATRERELAAAKEGKNLRWQAANFMLAARAALNAIDENPAAAGIALTIERAQRAYDDAEAYSDAHQSEFNPTAGALPPAWKAMEIGAGFFLKDAKELRRALELGKATPTELSSKYGYVVNEFNNLVISYNNYQQ
jgi:hypothetical protein